MKSDQERGQSVQPVAAPLQDQPPEGLVGLPDLFGQLFNIAAGQFRIDARPTGIVELDFDSLGINHDVTFLLPSNFRLSLVKD